MRIPAHSPMRLARVAVLGFLVFVISCRLWSSRMPHEQHDDDDDDDASLLSDQERAEAEAVCRPHGWAPYPWRTPRRKVYDLCMVNDELDWLEIRLNTTYDAVDYFVVVEAPLTFTGLAKPLTIRDSWARFAPYHAKMLYHTLTYPPAFDPRRAWDREDLQRNALLLQVLDGDARAAAGEAPLPPAAVPRRGDVLLVADVDEIPRPAALQALRRCLFPRRVTLRSRFYYYSFQFRHRGKPDRPENTLPDPWPHPQATYFEGFRRTLLPVDLRNGDGGSLADHALRLLGLPLGLWRAALARPRESAALRDGAWHCSSCYATMAELLHKLESVSHTWMNHPYYRDRDRAADHVRRGLDLWDREDEVYDRIDHNPDVPDGITAQPHRFAYLLSRDGPSAGFRDYP